MEYSYQFLRYNFNLHIRCTDLPVTMESEVHIHPPTPFWKSHSLAAFVAKKVRVYPISVPPVVSIFIMVVHLSYTESKLYAISTPSTSPTLLKSIYLILDFVKYVFRVWTHTMDFTIALSAIFLSMSIVLWIGETWRNSNMRCLPSQKLY